MNSVQSLESNAGSHHFRTRQFDFVSFFFSGLTGLATLLILAILAVILGNIIINGWPSQIGRASCRERV